MTVQMEHTAFPPCGTAATCTTAGTWNLQNDTTLQNMNVRERSRGCPQCAALVIALWWE